MASLLSKGGHNRIRILPKGDVHFAYDILTIVSANDPEAFTLSSQSTVVRVQAAFRAPIDAVPLELHFVSLNQLTFSEAALGRRPVDTRSLPSVLCSQKRADRTDLSLRIDVTGFERGEWLANIKVREEGKDGWQPITNVRLDEFSFAFVGHLDDPNNYDDEAARFFRLNEVLMRCFSIETWPSVERSILQEWKERGLRLASTTVGRWQLIKGSGDSPPAIASPSWVPIFHPLELAPDMYESSPKAFLPLSNEPAEEWTTSHDSANWLGLDRLLNPESECRFTLFFSWAFQTGEMRKRTKACHLGAFRFSSLNNAPRRLRAIARRRFGRHTAIGSR